MYTCYFSTFTTGPYLIFQMDADGEFAISAMCVCVCVCVNMSDSIVDECTLTESEGSLRSLHELVGNACNQLATSLTIAPAK